jgi:glycosyltransferase involved in cell wall biosynthesis
MMPFALNESTRYISPTKTLEYFAAGKPVISTYIRDVVVDYQYIVRLIRTSADFEAAIEYYLKEPAGARIQRENIQEALVTEASWDQTVKQMHQIIIQTFRKKEKPVETAGIP